MLASEGGGTLAAASNGVLIEDRLEAKRESSDPCKAVIFYPALVLLALTKLVGSLCDTRFPKF